ncbi:MAG: SDR family NAD(P)-dependent oxidoreductase [Flavobacteriales bacterium]|nr:SDR family NAD(P)-dependent oxidoreductase [Flavobacteriales bacterium]
MTQKVKNANILITGANGGIGIEVVRLLIEQGAKKIYLACRTQKKAEEVISKLPGHEHLLVPIGNFDMTNPKSIASAVEFKPKETLDIVFLQAGGMVVSEGFEFVEINGKCVEKTIQQNAIGGILTFHYLDKKGLISQDARIVFAGGEGARGIPNFIRKPDFKTPKDLEDYISSAEGNYSAIDALGVSKFVSALLVQKLSMNTKSRDILWFSPGLTGGTKGLDALKNPKRFLMKHIGFPIMQFLGVAQGPKRAAMKYVGCLNGEHGKNGDLIGAPEGKAIGKLVDQKPMHPSLTNRKLIDELWAFISEVYGLQNVERKVINKLKLTT